MTIQRSFVGPMGPAELHWVGQCTNCHRVAFRHFNDMNVWAIYAVSGVPQVRLIGVKRRAPHYEVCVGNRYTSDRFGPSPCGGMIKRINNHDTALAAYQIGGEAAVRALLPPVTAPK